MLDRTQSALVVIDIQDKLLPQDAAVRQRLIERTVKLIQSAHTLGIPVLATEQNPDRLGQTTDAVREALGTAPRLGKLEFGCLNNAPFKEALDAAGRRQVLLTGIEAHICVLQTALGALDAKHEVFVARDAIASLDPEEYEAGLARMERAGVNLVTAQMAIFEWLGAAGTPEFKAMLPLLK